MIRGQETGEIIPFPVLILPFPVFKAILDLLVKVSGWMEQMGIRLTSASTGVRVEVGAELGKNNFSPWKKFQFLREKILQREEIQ